MIIIYTWTNLNNDITNYINNYLFPNLIAFSIVNINEKNKELLDDINSLYNSLKSILNVSNEDKKVVLAITKSILENKYNIVDIDI